MPVYLERSILELPSIYVNGGARGFLVRLGTQDLERALGATAVEVAIEKQPEVDGGPSAGRVAA